MAICGSGAAVSMLSMLSKCKCSHLNGAPYQKRNVLNPIHQRYILRPCWKFKVMPSWFVAGLLLGVYQGGLPALTNFD